jgi:hypothetical protein
MREWTMGRGAACSLALVTLGSTVTSSAPPARRLVLQIHQVQAVRETRGKFGMTAGADEMALTGVKVGPAGEVAAILPKWSIGKFGDDGDTRTLSKPHQLATFDLESGPEPPRAYHVTLVLAELDQGDGVEKFVKKLAEEARTNGKPSGGSEKSDGGAVSGVVASMVAEEVKKAVKKEAEKQLDKAWNDDIFKPTAVDLRIDRPDAPFVNGKTTSAKAVARFKGFGGDYRVTYSWRLL